MLNKKVDSLLRIQMHKVDNIFLGVIKVTPFSDKVENVLVPNIEIYFQGCIIIAIISIILVQFGQGPQKRVIVRISGPVIVDGLSNLVHPVQVVRPDADVVEEVLDVFVQELQQDILIDFWVKLYDLIVG